MAYLRITLWGAGLIVLTELLKKITGWVFPAALPFHHNFFTCLQVLLLAWMIITLLQVLVNSGKPVGKRSNRIKWSILFIIVAVPEILFTYWLHHPSKIPPFLVPSFRYYYGGMQRNIIQFNPASSVYDSSLLYTLKPSAQFVFSNYEFADTFRVNKMGLRDDESSLLKPGIICIGDSYTMGWGVAQTGTFAERLSLLAGEIVLNAGMSSYGTVREIKNLGRLDTSNLQTLIIQYSRNDAVENEQFVQDSYSLELSGEKIYNTTVQAHYWTKLWFPGKHYLTIARLFATKHLRGALSAKKETTVDSSAFLLHRSAILFADILLHSVIDFNKTKVYVTDINEPGLMNDAFLNEVKVLAAVSPYRERFSNNLIMVPVADTLTAGDYYILDDHLRPSGHHKIAKRLYSYMFPGK